MYQQMTLDKEMFIEIKYSSANPKEDGTYDELNFLIQDVHGDICAIAEDINSYIMAKYCKAV